MDGLAMAGPAGLDFGMGGQFDVGAMSGGAMGVPGGGGAMTIPGGGTHIEKRRRLQVDGLPAAKRDRFNAGPHFMKILAPNEVVGAVIGRSGEALDLLERTTGTVLKIAPAGCYYPGSSERVMVIAGEQPSILRAVSEGLLARLEEASAANGGRVNLRVLAPKAVCGSIIGRGGHEVRQVCQTTSAHVNVLPALEPLDERIVQIQGPRNPVEQATNWLLARLAAEENLEQVRMHLSVDYADGCAGMSTANARNPGNHPLARPAPYSQSPLGMAQPNGNSRAPPTAEAVTAYWSVAVAHPDVLDTNCLIFFQVTEMQAGCILGKQGRQIQEITQFTRTKIQLSPRDTGSGIEAPRTVEISGRAEDVHAAHMLLLKCMKSADEEAAVAAGMQLGPGMGNMPAAPPASVPGFRASA